MGSCFSMLWRWYNLCMFYWIRWRCISLSQHQNLIRTYLIDPSKLNQIANKKLMKASLNSFQSGFFSCPFFWHWLCMMFPNWSVLSKALLGDVSGSLLFSKVSSTELKPTYELKCCKWNLPHQSLRERSIHLPPANSGWRKTDRPRWYQGSHKECSQK